MFLQGHRDSWQAPNIAYCGWRALIDMPSGGKAFIRQRILISSSNNCWLNNNSSQYTAAAGSAAGVDRPAAA